MRIKNKKMRNKTEYVEKEKEMRGQNIAFKSHDVSPSLLYLHVVW
jgi:hypothetical protein